MEKKTLAFGIAAGLLGGGILISISELALPLGYIGGNLLILTCIILVFSSAKLYCYFDKRRTTFWQRVTIGSLTYIFTILVYTLKQIINGSFNLHQNSVEYLVVISIHIAFAFLLSVIISACLRNGNPERENNYT